MDPVPEVLGRSVLVSVSATLIALAIGVPLGPWLALARIRGRGGVAVAVNTGMAVPTVVVGLLVALVLWRSGPLGNLDLIYTLRGMVIAQILIATPLIAGITMAGLQALRLLFTELMLKRSHWPALEDRRVESYGFVLSG